MTTVGHLINGVSKTPEGRTQDVFNPSTGEVSKQVAAGQATGYNPFEFLVDTLIDDKDIYYP